MLDKKTVIDIVQRYVEAVINEFSPTAVVLFGSYVNGNPNENSDIDVGVVFDGFVGDWRQTTARLWRLRRAVSYDIEPHLLDIADDKSGFVKHVMQTGQVIYTGE